MGNDAHIYTGNDINYSGTENQFETGSREYPCYTLPPTRKPTLSESFSADSTDGNAQSRIPAVPTVTRPNIP